VVRLRVGGAKAEAGLSSPRYLERPVRAVARGSQTFESRTEPADRRRRVGPWGTGFPGWRAGEFTAYGVRMRQCVKSEGSRATCPRQLFTEEGGVEFSSTVGGDRGIADVTSLSVHSQTARTGWVEVRSEEAGSAPFRLRL
jgi:hypothetical protein